MPNSQTLYLGLDIGGTKSAAIIGTPEGQVLARREWPSGSSRGPEPMLADLIAAARELLREFPAKAAGVSIGGPLDAARGIVLSPPHLPGWDAFPLRDRLEKALQLPVAVEHDAAACALAEAAWGTFAGTSRLIYLTCGTGFGAGILLDGKAYRGAGGHSVELGHGRFAEEGPELFGKRGSIEGYCAGAGIPLLAAAKYPQRWGAKPPTVAELAALARQGDTEAASILEWNARSVGQVAANLADLLFPEVILLGSMARHLGAGWVGTVRAKFLEEAHPHARNCKIEPASLGERLQDLSALVVALP